MKNFICGVLLGAILSGSWTRQYMRDHVVHTAKIVSVNFIRNHGPASPVVLTLYDGDKIEFSIEAVNQIDNKIVTTKKTHQATQLFK